MCKSSTCTSDRPQILLWSPFCSLSSPSLPCLCSLPIKENHKNRQLSTQCQTNCCVIAASQEQEKLNFIKINWRQHMSNIKPMQPNRPTPTNVLELRPYGWMPPPASRLQFTSMSVQTHVCQQIGSYQCNMYDCTDKEPFSLHLDTIFTEE